MRVIIKSDFLFIFSGEETLMTQTNSPGVNMPKA